MPAVRKVATAKPKPVAAVREVMDTKAACDYLDISDKCLAARIRAGEIVPSRIGRLHRFRKCDLDAFLARSAKQPEHRIESVVLVLEMDNEDAARLIAADSAKLESLGIRGVRPAGSV